MPRLFQADAAGEIVRTKDVIELSLLRGSGALKNLN
jgi:hypothetical protein